MNVLGLFILLAVGLGVVLSAAVVFLVYSLTHPPRVGYAHALARGLPGSPGELTTRSGGPRRFEEWSFTSRGRSLAVWDVAGDDARGPVVILTHGWGSGRVRSLLRVSDMAPLCARMLLWDLPGHGDSPGVSTLGVDEVDDLAALVEAVAGREGGPEIVLMGSSLGAGVCLAVAARGAAVTAVIAQAPYRMPITPARNVMNARGFPTTGLLNATMAVLGCWQGQGIKWAWPGRRGGPGSAFDRAQLAAEVRVPVLVLWGDGDSVVPREDAEEIAAACLAGKFSVVAGAGHNDFWTEPANRENASRICGGFLRSLRNPKQVG